MRSIMLSADAVENNLGIPPGCFVAISLPRLGQIAYPALASMPDLTSVEDFRKNIAPIAGRKTAIFFKSDKLHVSRSISPLRRHQKDGVFRNMELQAPFVLAQLPRALGASAGKCQLGEVHGVAGPKKRKRHEVVAAIDGESVNIYNVRAMFLYLPFILIHR